MATLTFKRAILAWAFFGGLLAMAPLHAEEVEARRILADLILGAGDEREASVEALSGHGDEIIKTVLSAWRVGEISLHTPPGSEQAVVLLRTPAGFTNVATGESVTPAGALVISRPDRALRKQLKRVMDLLDLSAPDLRVRIAAVQKLGLSQNAEYLPVLRERVALQDHTKSRQAFEEAIHISLLANGSPDEQLAAVIGLGDLKSFPARDFIEKLVTEEKETLQDGTAPAEEKAHAQKLVAAAERALEQIDGHQKVVNFFGTLFRGVSLGSVLLLVAYGLAITFGLMGVINMAHGEFIAIGGYTVYLVQGFFAKSFGEGTAAYETYFLWALPAAFFAAALCGILLERSVIQFLYRRPLESLLATWGISMVLQQAFRLKFGAANVAVSSPQWLSSSYDVGGVTMTYNRLFLIGFALFVIVGTWLLFTRTRWGLHVRATMQNRQMASSLGIRSSRVNMLTFAFGSGLAGLAGAFISQIGNVGPSMGQTYIVDSFMVVVIGGVGNLAGAALSSLGIGMADQSLQPFLGPVMGKITVLFGIILFLQLKPGGLFPARSRSLDD